MFIDIYRQLGEYLHDVFVQKVDFWTIIGLTAQLLFTARFVVQWVASERAGRSMIPFAFWVFSIGGSALLFAYAVYRRDPVFILGQAFGIFVYLRNIQLLFKRRRADRKATLDVG